MDDILGRLERLGADFASVRYERTKSLSISLMENDVFQVVENEGIGGRAVKVVMKGGHSHFGTAQDLTPADLKYAILINSKRGEEKVPENAPVKARVKIKPTDGLLKNVEEKVEDIRKLRMTVAKCGRRLRELSISYEEELIHKEYVDSLGSRIIQDFPMSTLDVTAVSKNTGGFATAWEHKATNKGYVFDLVDSEELRQNVRRQLDAQLRGVFPKAGYYEVVLAPEAVGTLCHEVLGHLAEGDMAECGILSSLKGRRIASDSVSIADYPTVADDLAAGFTPYDDEGTKGRAVKILEKGILKDLMTNRHYANALNENPTGNARAESYNEPPIVRMRNTFMAPGDQSAEELISSIRRGLLIRSAPTGTGSPEGNFQFGIMEGYRIEKGEIKEGLKPGISMAGHVLETLARITGTSKESGSVSANCGKDDQDVCVSYGGPYARVSRLKVGGHA